MAETILTQTAGVAPGSPGGALSVRVAGVVPHTRAAGSEGATGSLELEDVRIRDVRPSETAPAGSAFRRDRDRFHDRHEQRYGVQGLVSRTMMPGPLAPAP